MKDEWEFAYRNHARTIVGAIKNDGFSESDNVDYVYKYLEDLRNNILEDEVQKLKLKQEMFERTHAGIHFSRPEWEMIKLAEDKLEKLEGCVKNMFEILQRKK